jgi:hypothetical protein
MLVSMRIDIRDEQRRRIGRAIVDADARPTRVMTTDSGEGGREVFLNWDTALDDAGRLRRCVVCGCPDLFQEKAFPQVTAIVVVLAFAGAIAGIFGLVTNVPVLIAMLVVLALDIGILLFSRRRLVCYRCRSSYHGLPIARYHRTWDRPTAERHPAPAAAAVAASSPAALAPRRSDAATTAAPEGLAT